MHADGCDTHREMSTQTRTEDTKTASHAGLSSSCHEASKGGSPDPCTNLGEARLSFAAVITLRQVTGTRVLQCSHRSTCQLCQHLSARKEILQESLQVAFFFAWSTTGKQS